MIFIPAVSHNGRPFDRYESQLSLKMAVRLSVMIALSLIPAEMDGIRDHALSLIPAKGRPV